MAHARPQEPREQLWGAVGAVFESWMNQRAITYRRLHSIPESWGTAVNVQAMVFGNMGEDCATGVAFTRDAGTGEDGLARTRSTCAALARLTGLAPVQILPFSTGVIMEPLPNDRIEAGLPSALAVTCSA